MSAPSLDTTQSADRSRLSLAALVVTFAALWVPLGQHEFLHAHWMKVGTFMAPFLVFVAVACRSDAPGTLFRDLRFVSLVLLVAYIIHQFEEHWVDLTGEIYAFKPYVNGLIRTAMGRPDSPVEALSDAGVFMINTSLVWLVASLAIWRGSRHAFPTLCMAAIVLFNAFSHIAAGALRLAYNPGLVTSIVIFVPLAMAVYAMVLQAGQARRGLVVASLVWSALAHVIMVGGMIASGWFGAVPEPVYFAVLVAWSILPCLLFRGVRAAG
ncbi:MAG: HXXEE domain-containing protein [Pseudomonadota bacterium]